MRPHRLEQDRCDLCELCDEVCGRGIFTVRGQTMAFEPEGKCIACGHCMAVCPRDALVLEDGSTPLRIDNERLPDAADLLHFFRSRRSTRKFKDETPDKAMLESLVEAARFAPTGTNKQDVQIIMVKSAERITELRERIMARFGEYERHLKNPVKRYFLKTFVNRLLGEPEIREYLKNFMDGFRRGKDPLFHFAPVLAFLHTGKAASTPKDDCVIALYQMVLMAERLGLGSCLLGTAEIAFARTPSLNDLLGIPRGVTIQACACFGHPRIRFKRLAERNPPPVRWL